VRRNLHHEHGIRLLHALLVRSVVRCCDRDVDAAAIGIRHERRGAGVLPAGRVASHAAVTVLVDEQPNSAGMPLPNGDTTSAVRAHPEIMARFACEPMPPFPRVSMLFETWSMDDGGAAGDEPREQHLREPGRVGRRVRVEPETGHRRVHVS
jgi:hypothetical protein